MWAPDGQRWEVATIPPSRQMRTNQFDGTRNNNLSRGLISRNVLVSAADAACQVWRAVI